MAVVAETISAGLLAAGAGVSWLALRRRRVAVGRARRWQQRRIRVRGGYEPAEIHVSEGVPVRLVFRREEDAPCSERVVFPDLGISVGLPAFRDTVVELPASAPGTHPFTCEMEMLRGRLIVDPAGTQARAAHHDGRTVAA